MVHVTLVNYADCFSGIGFEYVYVFLGCVMLCESVFAVRIVCLGDLERGVRLHSDLSRLCKYGSNMTHDLALFFNHRLHAIFI
jgi:hypothetical protein